MNNFSERLNKLQEATGLEKTNFGFNPYKWVWMDGNNQVKEETFDVDVDSMSDEEYKKYESGKITDDDIFKDYLKKKYPNAKIIKVKHLSGDESKQKEQLAKFKNNFSETQTPAESTTPVTPTESEVVTTQEGESTPAVVEPMNLSENNKTPEELSQKDPETSTTPSEVTCPECGKTVVLNFDNLTDDEFNEIKTEAQEITKYPEQYETEADQIHAFSDWLESSRLKDFCKEALFKAFCGTK